MSPIAQKSDVYSALWLNLKFDENRGKSTFFARVAENRDFLLLRTDFQKKDVLWSRVCRTVLFRCALESADPGASNGA